MSDRTKMERPQSVISPKLNPNKKRLSLWISAEMEDMLNEIGTKWDVLKPTAGTLIIDEYLQDQIRLGNIKRRKQS